MGEAGHSLLDLIKKIRTEKKMEGEPKGAKKQGSLRKLAREEKITKKSRVWCNTEEAEKGLWSSERTCSIP